MAVKLRLRRTGGRNKPTYRIVATDGRSPRDGRFIEILGFYDPRGQNEKIDLERADYWIGNGAQPSETVTSIIGRARKGTPLTPAPGPQKPQIGPEFAGIVTRKLVTAKVEAAEAPAEAEAEAAAPVATEAEAPAADAAE